MDNRISERNRIKTRTRELESFIRFNTNAMIRLRQGSSNIEFCKTRIEKMKKDNDALEQELKELSDRQKKLASGELDQELSKLKRRETVIANKKTQEKRQKKLEELADKAKRSKISKEYWDKTLKAGREARYKERSSKRGYDYVLRVHQSLPQYIRANLANMPNNKGYIWRGVHYYGLKDPEKDQHLVMFENKKGQLHIHEWSKDYLIYVLTVKQKKQSAGEIVRIKRFTRKGVRRVLVSDEIPKPGEPNPLKSRRGASSRSRHGASSRSRHGASSRSRRTPKYKSQSRSKKRSAQKKTPRNNGVKRTPKQKPRSRKLTPAEARERSRGRGGRSNGRSRKKKTNHRGAGGRGVQGRARGQKSASDNQTWSVVAGQTKQKTGGAGRGKHRTLPAWMDKK
jgi:hypothetical protein